jgi:hypothetical protein
MRMARFRFCTLTSYAVACVKSEVYLLVDNFIGQEEGGGWQNAQVGPGSLDDVDN